MRNKLFLLALVFSLSASPALSQEILTCPAKGKGGDSKLNLKKNRTDIPSSGVLNWKLADLKAIDEPDSWTSGTSRSSLVALGEDKAIQVKGFLLMVRQGGKESCNCGLSGVVNTDLHLVLGNKATTTETRSVTGEISPRIRLTHPGWTKAKLNNIADEELEVRITGYVLLDTQHIGKSTPVRSTNWEIHPITEC